MNDIKSKHILRKYLLMIACLILFMAGGYRAFTLYKQYKSYNHEIESVLQNADNNVHAILKAILVEGHDIIENNTKNDAITLHRILIETMDIEDIYDNIVNMDLDDKFIKILDEVFNLSEKTDDIIITVGTKNYVFYSKSNVELDKFKYIESNGKKYLTWEEYYKQVDDKGVLHKAYEDLALERVDHVIIRKDGYYPNGKYYTIDDVIADYHENGMKNMDKYMILTMSVITENGDIFGEVDSNYLSKNENVNKIFIFKAVSIGSFLSNYTDLLAQCDQSVTVKIIEYRNSTEASNALVNIFLITSSIITIMVVIKSLDDECNEINDKLKNDENK
jgi:hypothetical protein